MFFFGLLLFIMVIFIQPQEFWGPVLGAPLVQLTMMGVGAGWCVRLLSGRRPRFLYDHQSRLMLAFWGIIAFSVVQLQWKAYILITLINWGKFVLIYYVIIGLLDSPRKIRIVLWVMCMSMLFTAWMGIQQYFGNDITGRGIGWMGRIRGIGIFDTNQLAYTCMYMAPLVVALFRMSRNFFARFILIITFSMFYYCVYLTGSRGGMLAGVFFFMLTFILHTKSKAAQITGIVITGLFLTGFMALAPRLQTLTDYEADSSAMGRINVWSEALITLKYAPLGIGKDEFKHTFKIAPHSSYIQVATELGFPGLFVWLAMFFCSLKNLTAIAERMPASHRNMIILSHALQISLYLYLLSSFFSGSGYYVTLYILLAITVAMQRVSALPEITGRGVKFTARDLIKIGIAEIVILGFIHILCKTSG